MGKLVYIAGYGRSGSTLLELILNQSKHIFAMGEFVNIKRNYKENKRCTCGSFLYECEVWSKLVEGIDFKDYDTIKEAYDYIMKRFQLNYVVDSSKTSFKYLNHFMKSSRLYKDNIVVFHIIRNPNSVLLSAVKGSNQALEVGRTETKKYIRLRTEINWMISNLATLAINKVFKNTTKVIIQENMIKNTSEFGNFLAQQFNDNDLIIRDGEINNLDNHMIDGNRLRHEKKIKIVVEKNSGIEDYGSILTWINMKIYNKIKKTYADF